MSTAEYTVPVGLGADLLLLTPLLAVFAGAMAVMLIEAVVRPADRWLQAGISGITLMFALGLLVLGPSAGGVTAFSGMLRFDAYATFFNVLLVSGALIVVLLSPDYLQRIGVRVGEYYALILFAVLGMMLLALGNDLMLMFVAVEIMSIAVYVLAAIKREDSRSVESGFKYFILGAFSSALLLYGIALVYGATGTTSLDGVRATVALGESGALLYTGLGLLLVGFGFKVGAVPFHMWTPDVYQGAPVTVTAFMASGVKAASFAAFGRVLLVGFLGSSTEWVAPLWILCALTMLVGNIAALVQSDLKRILAYSSIGHAGFAMMALVAAHGSGNTEPASALLFYLAAYTIMTLGAFAVLGLLGGKEGESTDISDLAGLAEKHPYLAASLALSLLSLAGIPPTVGFVGKFQLFVVTVHEGFIGLAVIGAISGAIGVYYYLRPIVLMYMHPSQGEALEVGRATRVVLSLVAVAILAFGLLPSALLPFCKVAAASLGV